ncbi:MAG: DNA-binding transcriptional LysR family regulator [Parasphingorhabdus sp.]|jgi:DNA-binding transcriptional LysR family regulator
MNSNWDDLRFFLAIARQGTLTGAGKILGVSQPTVSRRLESLEGQLKTRLFDHSRLGYELTSAGLDLFETTQKLEQDVAEVQRRIYGEDQNLTGGLRITCTEIFLNGFLTPFIWKFSKRHPDIELSILCTQSQLNLSRNDADLAIRFTRHPPENLVGHNLAGVAYAIYAAKDCIGTQYDPADRDSWEWIGVHDEMHNRMLFQSVLPKIQFKHRIDDMSAMQSMVQCGLGVSVLPCYIADRDPLLQRLHPDILSESTISLWVLHHPDVRRVYRLRLFVKFLKDLIKDDLDLIEGRRPLSTEGGN